MTKKQRKKMMRERMLKKYMVAHTTIFLKWFFL